MYPKNILNVSNTAVSKNILNVSNTAISKKHSKCIQCSYK